MYKLHFVNSVFINEDDDDDDDDDALHMVDNLNKQVLNIEIKKKSRLSAKQNSFRGLYCYYFHHHY